MQAIYDQLLDLDVPDARIFAEAFGPASLQRRTGEAHTPRLLPSTKPVPVAFAKSGKEARWEPNSGTLLELAEARGLTPDYSCRSGSCGTCAVRIVAGRVSYPTLPAANVGEDEALVCCAVPAAAEAAGADRLILDL